MPDDLVAGPIDPTPPLPPPAPTQTKYPWRSTLRTVFQAALSLAVMLPLVIGALGLDANAPAIAAVLVGAGAFARLMALPQVEDFLQKYVPWLAAKPASNPFELLEDLQDLQAINQMGRPAADLSRLQGPDGRGRLDR